MKLTEREIKRIWKNLTAVPEEEKIPNIKIKNNTVYVKNLIEDRLNNDWLHLTEKEKYVLQLMRDRTGENNEKG